MTAPGNGNGAHTTDGARITVVYPLWRAAGTVDALVQAVARQRPPEGADPATWMEALFIDDASPDGTTERLREALAATEVPFPVRVLENEHNLGLARNLNRALATVDTDYVLTCHVDCRFGDDDYVARAVRLLDAHPDVGAIAGQSTADPEAGLSRAEKVYMAANLMDVFPPDDEDLLPVGFAEGRCDAFRMAGLEAAGFYDTTLRTAGEDQILASRLRAAGYRVCQAPQLRYHLSVSSSQDSLRKLVRHARLFGRMHPYLLFVNRGTMAGAAGGVAGGNRTRRSVLRGLQLAGGGAWAWLAGALLLRRSRIAAATAVLGIQAGKALLFRRYVRELRFDRGDRVALTAIQPALDASYAAGFIKGLAMLTRRDGRTIA
ncbi:MAG TPA: glycosyltransferase [Miltoncostaea sp.]|nr:glycosyltransferase [Miltoncostaea sp.]